MYDGLSLIADPVHGYISFTVREDKSEMCEQDIIDTAWVQRLRYIYQLQSARWVFPSAEHSRFQHSLGTMHVAGRFAKHLYPSLKEIYPDIPSANYIEELLRLAGLLHDIGHGPFGHFFDDNYLEEFGHTHESLGAEIITRKFDEIISMVRRSPSGVFDINDQPLDSKYIAYLINKHPGAPGAANGFAPPRWLDSLKPILSGIYTADNLDYVLRDSYMCGVAVGPVDLDRLLYYSCITEKGFTIHKAGLPALIMFLNARLYLYSNVYYHRTTRAIDIHLKEIFRDTIRHIWPLDPMENLDDYVYLTDWFVLESVKQWGRDGNSGYNELAGEWEKLLCRNIKWKMAYDTLLSLRNGERGLSFINPEELKRIIKSHLPADKKGTEFKVDMAAQDPRPVNPFAMGDKQIYVLDPIAGRVSPEGLREFFEFLPAKIVRCRIYTTSYEDKKILAELADMALNHTFGESCKTNI